MGPTPLASRLPFAGTVGLEVVLAAKERIEARMQARADLCTPAGALHGGAAASPAHTLGTIGEA